MSIPNSSFKIPGCEAIRMNQDTPVQYRLTHDKKLKVLMLQEDLPEHVLNPSKSQGSWSGISEWQAKTRT